MRKTGNPIVDLSFEFSLSIIRFSEQLEEKQKFVISKQILRSGTSIGANIWESQNAESKIDFIHKLKIAAKETEETEYWLLLCQYSENYPDTEELRVELLNIKKLLSKIISSTKASLKNKEINTLAH
ncbi:MAG: four helix bundle protein [Bacteroidota bacterium]|jgi:four helix bundle protein